ncbi:MAG: hypothetical protein SFY66_28280 [Oculatellaceae cyanobacterium bins.114]|nr:hypothetical protein [Oculatellaceae cyanobacterium bins.114]
MSSETDTSETSAIVPVSPETNAMVDSEMAGESDDIRRETKALIEAVKKRAQVEVQSANDFTREAYLKAVRQAREAIEENKLIDPERIEKSIELIQKEAEKNWQSVVTEAESFGTRLSDAAKAAWNALMHPESK